MLALVLVACSLAADNLAAAIAIGVSGVDARLRLRVGLVFGAFEACMPLIGLALGAELAGTLGQAGRWLAAVLLIGVGAYALWSGARSRETQQPLPTRIGGLALAGLVLSIDNLVVGFALGSTHTSVLTGAVVIGAVSVVFSLAGLELGARIGARAGERGEQLAGLMLIAIGVAIAAGVLS
jgi:manganese efflux pump family protein